MVTASSEHPDREQLRAFGLGKLAAADSDMIEAHLSECTPCCDTLASLRDDTFLGLVRQAAELLPSHASQAGASVIIPEESLFGHTTELIPRELTEHPRYRILKLAGKGGMGLVFKAEHRLMNRVVALKVIRERLIANDEAVRRFRREVQAAAQLSHPNIVTAYDADQAANLHFLVMEYVDGTNLSEVIHFGGPLEIAKAADYARQVALGLDHAHSKGMVHRDIKPHDLMVNAAGQVKILDFGLASLALTAMQEQTVDPAERKESSYVTSLGMLMGTPDFIAPEQAKDARCADIRSDLYGLGCTLFYLLTGRAPFARGSALETVQAQLTSEPPSLAALRPDVPQGLVAVVERLLAKEPSNRYQTPGEVAEALAPFAAHVTRPLPAPSPDPTGQPRRMYSARNFLIGLGLAGLVALAAVFFVEWNGTTIRFEVQDPNLAITFGEQSITVKNADQQFTVSPGKPQRFSIIQNGAELETDTLTLERGQNVSLRISVEAGRARVTPSDSKVLLGQVQGSTPVVDEWVETLKRLEDNFQASCGAGLGILMIDPDDALKAMQKAWPQLVKEGVKVGMLDVFGSSKPLKPKKHPRTLQVLDLGMRDPDEGMKNSAAHYLFDITGIDFSGNPEAYAKWYAENGKRPIEEIYALREEKGTESKAPAAQAAEADSKQSMTWAQLLGFAAPPPAEQRAKPRPGPQASAPEPIAPPEQPQVSEIVKAKLEAERVARRVEEELSKARLAEEKAIMEQRFVESQAEAKAIRDKRLAAIETALGNDDVKSAMQAAAEDGLTAFIVPTMIGLVDADNSIYSIQRADQFLTKHTLVKPSLFHDGAWWRRWWDRNRDQVPFEHGTFAIPDFPKTTEGKRYQPFPASVDTIPGRCQFFREHPADKRLKLAFPESLCVNFNGPERAAAIPFLIGMLEAAKSPAARQALTKTLSDITGQQMHVQGFSWRNWWEENKCHYDEEYQIQEIPDLAFPVRLWEKGLSRDGPAEVVEIPSSVDEYSREDGNGYYRVIGPPLDAPIPKAGYRLVVVLPDKDSGSDTILFLRRLHKHALDQDQIVIQPLGLGQEKSGLSEDDRLTHSISGLERVYPLNKQAFYVLAWGSMGPEGYKLGLRQDLPITGTYIAMSPFDSKELPELEGAKGRAFYLDHARADQKVPFAQAQAAEQALRAAGAKVTLAEQPGGHGWEGDTFERLAKGFRWLDAHSVASPESKPSADAQPTKTDSAEAKGDAKAEESAP